MGAAPMYWHVHIGHNVYCDWCAVLRRAYDKVAEGVVHDANNPSDLVADRDRLEEVGCRRRCRYTSDLTQLDLCACARRRCGLRTVNARQ
jgi:hypothetical protein